MARHRPCDRALWFGISNRVDESAAALVNRIDWITRENARSDLHDMERLSRRSQLESPVPDSNQRLNLVGSVRLDFKASSYVAKVVFPEAIPNFVAVLDRDPKFGGHDSE